MHTVFMREHNRLVDLYAAQHPGWSSEELYQRARKTVGAELQSITFNEWLPAVLGPAAPSPTRTQNNPNLNPAVFNEFAAVFERVGHSMLTPAFLRIQNDGQPAPGGPVSLIDGFNEPSKVPTSNELSLFLKGLSVEVQDETDSKVVTDMRAALLDAVDIQRARDHGLPNYNAMRQAYGLAPVVSIADITSDVSVRQALASVYSNNVNAIDPLIGALAEDHLPGASVGPLIAAGLRVQFERLRDADRFWYESDPDFSPAELDQLRNTRLSDIIMRNTDITTLPTNVFFVPEPSTSLVALALVLSLVCTGQRQLRILISL